MLAIEVSNLCYRSDTLPTEFQVGFFVKCDTDTTVWQLSSRYTKPFAVDTENIVAPSCERRHNCSLGRSRHVRVKFTKCYFNRGNFIANAPALLLLCRLLDSPICC